MELQWPLILFTTFIAWSAGLFATQAIAGLQGKHRNVQMTALVTSFILMAIGGIAVFFHLQHWERIFNGFGHISSGITQELIAIVVLVVLMVVYFIFLRREQTSMVMEAADGTSRYLPAWIAVCAIIIAVVLDVVMAHSYMMPARPAWDSIFEIFSIIGASCIMGPATLALLTAIKGGDSAEPTITQTTWAGSIINLVCTVVYLVSMALAGGTVTNVGYYFDPTQSTLPINDLPVLFGGGTLLVTIITIALAVAPVILVAIGKKQTSKWNACVGITLACAVVGTVLLRILFYTMGVSVYPFY